MSLLNNRNIFIAVCTLLTALACSPMPGDPAAIAERCVQEGDTAKAVSILERTDIDRDASPQLRLRLGQLYRSRSTIRDRLRSQHVLERANQLFPDNADVLLELGRTYYAQTYYPDAEKCFRRALALNSDQCAARRFLGVIYFDRWRRVNAYTDDLDRARDHLSLALACDSTDVEAAVKYAYSLYVLESYDSLTTICQELAARFPERAEFRLLIASLAYDDEHFQQAHDAFLAALPLLPDNDRHAFEDINRILSYEGQDFYLATAPTERDVVVRRRWLDVDPDATTAINERRLEHLYRVFLADVFFAAAFGSARGWDTERGEVFIKFGWPNTISRSMGDSADSGREEIWFYPFQTFIFVDERLNGNLKIPYEADPTLTFLRHNNQAYAYQPGAISIPGDMDVITFKDDAFNASIYIAVEVDAESLLVAADPAPGQYFFRNARFSEQWEPDARHQETLGFNEISTFAVGGRKRFSLVHHQRAAFDYYHLASSFEDQHGRALAHLRADGDAYRYIGDAVTVSDLLLQAPPGRAAATILRGEHKLHPNPGHVFHPGERLGVYFEIYNLTARAGAAEYELTFAIYGAPSEPSPTWRRWGGAVARWLQIADDQEPAVTQSFERRVNGYRAEEAVRIDIDRLEAGRYQLVVSVRDVHNSETAETAVIFEKRDGLNQVQR